MGWRSPWGGWDLNPRSSGYEPAALTSLATAPRGSSLPNRDRSSGAWENALVDPIAWLVVAERSWSSRSSVSRLAPRLKRDNLRRQLEGGGGSFSGIGVGFDVVWRPSAEEAHGAVGGTGRDAGSRAHARRQGSRGGRPDRDRGRRTDRAIAQRNPAVVLVLDRRLRPDLRDRLGDADRSGARVRGIRRPALPRSIGSS